MTEDNRKPNAKTQSILSSVNPDAKPAESADETPACVSGGSHHWIIGEVSQLDDGGFEIASAQCRVCGYIDEIPEEDRMQVAPTEENES